MTLMQSNMQDSNCIPVFSDHLMYNISESSLSSNITENIINTNNEINSQSNLDNYKSHHIPWKTMSLVVLILIGHCSAISILSPFLGFWITKLTTLSREEAGSLSGLLVTFYALGQFISSKFYGTLSDHIGRKKVILFCILCNSIFCFLSGICKSFPLLLFIRFLWGLFNNTGSLAISFVKDISNLDNESIVFSSLRVAFNMSIIFGPLLGGVLYYQDDFNNHIYLYLPYIFHSYPALLPLMTLSLFNIMVFIISYFVIPESTETKSFSFTLLCTLIKNMYVDSFIDILVYIKITAINLYVYLENSIHNSDIHDEIDDKLVGQDDKNMTYLKVWDIIELRLKIITYTFSSIVEMSYNEIFPLFLLSATLSGGFELNAKQIGVILIIAGLVGIVSSFLYSFILNKIFNSNLLKMIQFSFVIIGFTCLFIPFTSKLELSSYHKLFLPTMMNSTCSFFMAWITISLIMFINKGNSTEHCGSVNAITQSCVQLAQVFVPALFSLFYSSTLKYHILIIFNYYTPFLVLGCIWFFIFFISFKIKVNINQY